MAENETPPGDPAEVGPTEHSGDQSTLTGEGESEAVVVAEAEPEVAAEPDADPEIAPVGEPAPAVVRRRRRAAPKAIVVSLRVVRGVVGAGIAAAVIAAVGLIPPPQREAPIHAVDVQPASATVTRVCTGALLRLGDEAGENAALATAVGTPNITVAAVATLAERSVLTAPADASRQDAQKPQVVTAVPGAQAALSAAQAQRVAGEGDLVGLATAACAEPTSSTWLVGGSTAVGRTTLLVLDNPTEVAAVITVRMWGESGEIVAPGMSLNVPARSQVSLPLSGFAPGLMSPVVHVSARGGQVVASLQTSTTRVLDPGGVDIVSASLGASTRAVIPAVRLFATESVAASLGSADHDDMDAVVRVVNPSSTDAVAQVEVSPVDGGSGTSFDVAIPAGTVVDSSLSMALALGAAPLADGSYTVVVSSDIPIVSAVRASTTTDGGATGAGRTDVAWFPSAPALRGETMFAVPAAPSPVLVLVNDGADDRTVGLESLTASGERTMTIPARGSASMALDADSSFTLRDADGLRAGVSFAGEGQLAGYVLRPVREADSAIVVRP